MLKEGANRGNAGKGRPKGAVNKVTRSVKDAIALAADNLGGSDRLVAWAKEAPENERVFWSQIYTKLLPLEASIRGPGGNGEILQKLTVEYVAPQARSQD